MSGLLHISQISFDRIEDLPSIMQMGMKLKCMIIDHDKVKTKSTKPRSLFSEVWRTPHTLKQREVAAVPSIKPAVVMDPSTFVSPR